MSAIVLLVGVGLAVGVLILAVVGRRDDCSPDAESKTWRRATGEVISVLRTHNRTFVLVRYTVGTSLSQNHVAYPLQGAVPNAGERLPIKYDAVSPARVVFDLNAHIHMSPPLPGPAISPSQGAHPGEA
jgi:hypothetical protein